jgi:hypothetical protein
MFQDGVHGNDVKLGIGEWKALHVRGNIGNQIIDFLSFQGTSMEIGPISVVTFLTKQPRAPAIAATHVQNPARPFAGVLQDECDISTVILGGLFRAACKRSPNMPGRISVKTLDVAQVHGTKSMEIID